MGDDRSRNTQRLRDLRAASEALNRLDIALSVALLLIGIVAALTVSYWLGHRDLSFRWPLVSITSCLLAVVTKLQLIRAITAVEKDIKGLEGDQKGPRDK